MEIENSDSFWPIQQVTISLCEEGSPGSVYEVRHESILEAKECINKHLSVILEEK
jgi:hypothetical protein